MLPLEPGCYRLLSCTVPRPRDDGVQFSGDCWVVLLLPREYVVDGRGRYAEVDFDRASWSRMA